MAWSRPWSARKLSERSIEETVRKTEAGRTRVTKLALVEVSKAALDPKLFEVPPDYIPAVETPRDGHDIRRPDTLSNRLQIYWTELSDSIRRWFHYVNLAVRWPTT